MKKILLVLSLTVFASNAFAKECSGICAYWSNPDQFGKIKVAEDRLVKGSSLDELQAKCVANVVKQLKKSNYDVHPISSFPSMMNDKFEALMDAGLVLTFVNEAKTGSVTFGGAGTDKDVCE